MKKPSSRNKMNLKTKQWTVNKPANLKKEKKEKRKKRKRKSFGIVRYFLRSRNDLNHNRLEKQTLYTHISYLFEQPRGNTYELITVCTPDLEVH